MARALEKDLLSAEDVAELMGVKETTVGWPAVLRFGAVEGERFITLPVATTSDLPDSSPGCGS